MPLSEACYVFFDEDFLLGTSAPARCASESPMAMACLRLVTFLADLRNGLAIPQSLFPREYEVVQ